MVITAASLYSGGKDSCFALHWAILHGVDVKCLITVRPSREDSWLFHYPTTHLVGLHSKVLGIPLETFYSSGLKYKEEEELHSVLGNVIEKYKINSIVTGALLSDYQRMIINNVAEELGLRVLSPLWRIPQDKYMRLLVEIGFKFIITTIACMGIPPTLLGRELSRRDVELIIERAKKYGFNPAFEGGEAETFVLDAPLFEKSIFLKGRPVKIEEYCWRLEVIDAGIK